ncbi:MAG: hypothetical protein ACKVQW_07230 [Pyrinomonadaceae bacterium]
MATRFVTDFKRLPSDLQNELIALQKASENRFVFLRKASLLVLVPVVFLIGWIIYVWSATQQPLWENWMYWLIGGVSVLGFPAAFWAVAKFLSVRLAKLKNGHMFTANEYFRVNGRRVECHTLRDLEALRTKHDEKKLELWIDDVETMIDVDDVNEAEKLENLFDGWKSNSTDEVGPRLRESIYAYRQAGSLVFIGGILLIGALVGAGFTYAFGKMNVAYDDDTTWTSAKATDTIEDYEVYQSKYPNGAHAQEAQAAISGHIGKLKDNYLKRAQKGADQDAVAKLAAIYELVGNRPDRTIYLKIDEIREIDPTVIDNLETKFGIKSQPYEYSVPPSGEAYRKQKIASDLMVRLAGVGPRGAIKHQVVETLPADAPSIEVMSTIKSEEDIYRITSFRDGRYQMSIYPAASFTFRFVLRTSADDSGYSAEYVENPRGVSSGAYRIEDKENYTFDKVLFSTAMTGFDRNFSRMFGLADTEFR